MEIKGDTIAFKSLPDLFTVERDGIKPNTVRLLNEQESDELEEMWGCIEKIKIIKSTNLDELFVRRVISITDITAALKLPLKKGWRCVVFSWVH